MILVCEVCDIVLFVTYTLQEKAIDKKKSAYFVFSIQPTLHIFPH